MAIEYRLVSFRQPLEGLIPPVGGGVKVLTFDMFGSVPELTEYMDGWESVSSQFLLLNSIEYVVTFTLKMTVNAPDIAAELFWYGFVTDLAGVYLECFVGDVH